MTDKYNLNFDFDAEKYDYKIGDLCWAYRNGGNFYLATLTGLNDTQAYVEYDNEYYGSAILPRSYVYNLSWLLNESNFLEFYESPGDSYEFGAFKKQIKDGLLVFSRGTGRKAKDYKVPLYKVRAGGGGIYIRSCVEYYDNMKKRLFIPVPEEKQAETLEAFYGLFNLKPPRSYEVFDRRHR